MVILTPVFGRAFENGRRSHCQINLKNISLSVLQYVRDNDQIFPPAVIAARHSESGTKHLIGWADVIQPYLKSTKFYQCPANPVGASDDPSNMGYVDYWYNANLSWNRRPGSAARWNGRVALKDLKHPQFTIMLGDAGQAEGIGTASTRCDGQICSGSQDVTEPAFFAPGLSTSTGSEVSPISLAGGDQTHLEGINLAFVDGHVKWIRRDAPLYYASVYDANTSFKISGERPTFNAVKP